MTRHFRLLAYLRWKYLWRSGGKSRKVGGALATFVSLGLSVFLFIFSSAGLSLAFRPEPTATSWEFVHLAFAALYLGWLYTGSFNDLYDPARLASFPLPPRTLFLGSTLSSFIGLSFFFGGALLAGFLTGVPGSAPEKVVRGVLFVLLLIHLQMTARLIRLTFLAILTSRRWRDAAILISTLVGGGAYVATQLLRTESADVAKTAVLRFAESGGPSHWLAWCPGVWLSWAFQLDGVRSAAGFGAFAALTYLVYRAGGWAEERLALSDPIFHFSPRKKSLAARVSFLKGVSRAILKAAGPVAAAVARKEFAVFFRDPVVRHRVLSSVLYILLPFTMLFVVRSRGPAPAVVEVGGFFLIFAEMFFLTNLFGLEGSAVRNLLWFPAPRRQVLLGKNLAYLALFVPFNVVVLIVLGLIMGSHEVSRMDPFTGATVIEKAASLERIPSSIAAHVSALLVVVALGNVTSVYFPLPFLAPGQRMTRRDESGCLMAAARSLLYLATFVLLAPVLAVSFLLKGSDWAFAAALLGLAYAAVLYLVGLKIAERALVSREEALGDYFRAA